MRTPERLSIWQIDAIGLGVCAALAALWYFAGLQPLSEAKAARAALGSTVVERGQEAQRLRTLVADIDKQIVAVQAELDSGSIHLVPADGLNERVADLTRLAHEQGLRLDQIRPGAPVALPRFSKVPIQVAGAGTSADCARFLSAVHARYPDVGVAAMDIRGEPEMPERGTRFVLDLVWYAAPDAGIEKK